MSAKARRQTMTAMLEVTNIRKRFGTVEVLKGISLSARRGDVIDRKSVV